MASVRLVESPELLLGFNRLQAQSALIEKTWMIMMKPGHQRHDQQNNEDRIC